MQLDFEGLYQPSLNAKNEEFNHLYERIEGKPSTIISDKEKLSNRIKSPFFDKSEVSKIIGISAEKYTQEELTSVELAIVENRIVEELKNGKKTRALMWAIRGIAIANRDEIFFREALNLI